MTVNTETVSALSTEVNDGGMNDAGFLTQDFNMLIVKKNYVSATVCLLTNNT